MKLRNIINSMSPTKFLKDLDIMMQDEEYKRIMRAFLVCYVAFVVVS
jgi:hypothetical protein